MIDCALYTKRTLRDMPADFRIGAIVSDGMWYTRPKWRKLAGVSIEELDAWIARERDVGHLLVSSSGESYRFGLDSILLWYQNQGLSISGGPQLLDFLWPPRVWDNLTEVEGFEGAPLRTVGVVTFTGSDEDARKVSAALVGQARVLEVSPGRFKAYCLSAGWVKARVADVLGNPKPGNRRVFLWSRSRRRELVDFSPEFLSGLLAFYRVFGRSMVKGHMDTIRMFIPDPEDQMSQIMLWVIEAVEKFDESSGVPFSAYLHNVLNKWPYDLPAQQLGKDLSAFQRQRSKALTRLSARVGRRVFSDTELAEELGMTLGDFVSMDEKNHAFLAVMSAPSLWYTDSADERGTARNVSGNLTGMSPPDADVGLSARLSLSVVRAALETGSYDDAFHVIDQMGGRGDVDMAGLSDLSDRFVSSLGVWLGMGRT